MDYIELSVTITPYNEIYAEILIAELSEVGCDSFTDIDSGLNAYIPKSIYNNDIIDAVLQQDINWSSKIYYIATLIKAENWNSLWESNFEPVIIDNKCTIKAPFHNNLPKTEIEVIIEPKMAFGTGHHETTYLMSEALLNNDLKEKQILDMGCGTGILAIIAALKGAKHVDAIDNDEWATNNAVENIIKNKLENKITVFTGDASLLGTPKYNLILANINRNILLNDMQYYVKSLLPNGKIIVSGIYVEDIPVIEKEASTLGLQTQVQQTRNKWAMIEFIQNKK